MAPKDGGNNHGRPNRRRQVEPGSAPRAHIRRKAEELMRDAGLPQHLAMRVAKAELPLTDALTLVDSQDRVARLITRHKLDKSLATQVVLGRVSLDQVLQRRRMLNHVESHKSKSILDVALADGNPRIFGLHGQRLVRARLTELDAYGLTLVSDEANAPAGPVGKMHKLEVKFVLNTTEIDLARAALKHQPEFEIQAPIKRPQDRFRCTNKRLFAWIDAKSSVDLTTLEGDLISGPLNWFGRWELSIRASEDLDIIVLRHAITNISGGTWDFKKED
jgi:hypothetical protein